MERTTPADGIARATWISLGAALALIMLGAIAALLPVAVGITVGILAVWIVVFSGMAHLVHAWDVRGDLFLWRLLVGLVYLCGGLYLVLNPSFDLAALTRFIGSMFLLEAALLLAGAWWMRRRRGSGWLALDGGATLLIAALIFVMWPWTHSWVLSLLVGLNVLGSGAVFLAMLRENRSSLSRSRA
jgi:uncharacterized membrane protein HdeD (DUF308 family)